MAFYANIYAYFRKGVFVMNTLKNIKNSSILSGKNRLISSIYASIVIGFCLISIFMPHATIAADLNTKNASYVARATNEAIKAARTINVLITAYSSTEDQTDDTPFITASGKYVKDGIIANNMLPFGTKVKIPSLYGDKVFTVQDRMNRKKGNYHIDIWMPSRDLALNFGVKTAQLEILKD